MRYHRLIRQRIRFERELFALHLEASVVSEKEALAALREANETSFIREGSHDASCCIVSVNGQTLPVVGYAWRWASVQNGLEGRDREYDVPVLPSPEAIECFSILQQSYHFGSSYPCEATLAVYERRPDGTFECRRYDNNSHAIYCAWQDGRIKGFQPPAAQHFETASGSWILDEQTLVKECGEPVRRKFRK